MDVRALNGSRPTGQRGQQIVSGMVSLEQPAPTSFNDPVYVVIEGHSSELSYPLPFDATHGKTLPAQGTPVVIGYDENNTPHILRWEGVYS